VKEILKMAGKRMAATFGAIALVMMMVGGAYALSGDSSTETPAVDASATPTDTATPSPSPTDGTEDGDEEAETGVHGGSVERVHDGCGEIEGLEGNWTHGDYVAAVGASTDDKEAKKAAAKSDCGKPVSSVHEEGTDEESDATPAGGRGNAKGKSKSKKHSSED
jgi:hypothetical protein